MKLSSKILCAGLIITAVISLLIFILAMPFGFVGMPELIPHYIMRRIIFSALWLGISLALSGVIIKIISRLDQNKK
jgi:cation transporter-like permease